MSERNNGRDQKRALRWLAWWALLMSLWVAADDSLRSDELLVGAGAAGLAALAAELITHQAAVRFEARPSWLPPAFRLPVDVARDTLVVFGTLLRREPPDSELAEVPLRAGDDTPLGQTRRLLLTWAHSLAPNTFVLGIDTRRNVMVVHRLVPGRRRT